VKFVVNGKNEEETCDAKERNLYVSKAYRTKASFSPGFIVHLAKQGEKGVKSIPQQVL
jgi:hypothetical protein